MAFIPGGEVTFDQLNTIQDDYDAGGFAKWQTIGNYSWGIAGNNATGGGDTYGRPDLRHGTIDYPGIYLNPADYPDGARTTQLRIVLGLQTNGFPINTGLQSAYLAPISAAGVLGTAISTISPGTVTDLDTLVTFEGTPITFPAAGFFVTGFNMGVSSASPLAFATGIISLQRRGI